MNLNSKIKKKHGTHHLYSNSKRLTKKNSQYGNGRISSGKKRKQPIINNNVYVPCSKYPSNYVNSKPINILYKINALINEYNEEFNNSKYIKKQINNIEELLTLIDNVILKKDLIFDSINEDIKIYNKEVIRNKGEDEKTYNKRKNEKFEKSL